MAIRSTKYMSESVGSATNAGTSSSRLALAGCSLDAGGTVLHYLNHGYVFAAGDALNIHDQEAGGAAALGVYEIVGATSDRITITPAAGVSAVTLVAVHVGGPWPVGYPARAAGTGSIDEAFGLAEPWVLVGVRAHFTGTAGHATFSISLDSTFGAGWDAVLYELQAVGSGARDVSFRLGTAETGGPSAWRFEAGDLLRFGWTNPGGQSWGLLVSMVPARVLEPWMT